MTLEIDFETRGSVSLPAVGAHNYFAHPDTSVRIASYSFDGGKTIRRWRFGEPQPQDLIDHLAAAKEICFRHPDEEVNKRLQDAGLYTEAHNAAFELGCFEWLYEHADWQPVLTEQFRCTAAMAAGMGLPRSLDDLGKVLGLSEKKDKEGWKLMMRLSAPKTREPLTWHEDPADLARLHDYCDQDVRTEAAARRKMVPLSGFEQRLWVLDQRINERGWRLDRRSAHAALALVDRGKREANEHLAALTSGAVTTVDQRERILSWLREMCDVTLPSLAKQDVIDALARPDLPAAAHEALTVRQEAAKASLAKLPKMLDMAGADGRLRGMFLFNGTGPGRWTSRGAQVHNLPRVRKVFEDAHPDPNVAMSLIRSGDPDLLRFAYGDDLGQPLAFTSDMIRSFLWAAPGHEFVVSDYSNIQGRIAAWLGGEQWKLDAFVAADEKRGPGLYELAAAGIYGILVEEVDKLMRQVGKVAELALGFQGGVGAFYNMSRGYNLRLESMYPSVWANADDETRDWAEKRWEECTARGESTTKLLSREAWIGADIVKAAWRRQNGGIALFWKVMHEAIREAVLDPGRRVSAGPITYLVKMGYLWCRLPSGRCICYGAPRMEEREVPWSDKTVEPKLRERAPTVTVATVAGDSGWQRYPLFGGLAFQNVVMGIERDVLALGMFAVEKAGYPIVGHVHDELVAEVPRGYGDVGEFSRLMAQVPGWAQGLPVVAAGWRGKRYRKA